MLGNLIRGLGRRPALSADAFGDLEEIREHIVAQKRAASEIAGAPRPVEDAMCEIDTWLDQAATTAVDQLRLGRMLRPGAGAALELPAFRAPGQVVADALPAVQVVLGLLIATNRAAFSDLVRGQLEDLADGRETLDDDARAERLAAAEAELLRLELAEEGVIRDLEAAGIATARRPDADPRALLAADAALRQG